MTTTVSVNLDSLTFGDLYDMVDLARGAGVPREKEVSQVPVDGYEEQGPVRLEVELTNIAVRAPDFSDIDRHHVIELLDEVIDSEGDARAALAVIKDIRDRLL